MTLNLAPAGQPAPLAPFRPGTLSKAALPSAARRPAGSRGPCDVQRAGTRLDRLGQPRQRDVRPTSTHFPAEEAPTAGDGWCRLQSWDRNTYILWRCCCTWRHLIEGPACAAAYGAEEDEDSPSHFNWLQHWYPGLSAATAARQCVLWQRLCSCGLAPALGPSSGSWRPDAPSHARLLRASLTPKGRLTCFP